MVKHLTKAAVFNALAAVGAELIFALLPLVVAALVLAFKEKSFEHVLASPEWAFGSAILAGQTLVKFVSGLTRAKNPSGPRVAFVIAAFFVGAVVPALTVLAMVIISEEHVPRWLIAAQLACFFVGTVMFAILGTLGHIWNEEGRARLESEDRLTRR